MHLQSHCAITYGAYVMWQGTNKKRSMWLNATEGSISGAEKVSYIIRYIASHPLKVSHYLKHDDKYIAVPDTISAWLISNIRLMEHYVKSAYQNIWNYFRKARFSNNKKPLLSSLKSLSRPVLISLILLVRSNTCYVCLLPKMDDSVGLF